MKRILIIASAALLLASCSSGYQVSRSQAADKEVARPYGDTAASRKITSLKGYSPTSDDVTRYKNDIGNFLSANVPNFSRYNKALIMIDDVKADSYTGLALSDVRLISVLDPSSAVILGTTAAGGAIVIKTK